MENTVDLKAKTIEVLVIEPPKAGSAEGVYLEKCECQNLQKPYEKHEVEELIDKALALNGPGNGPVMTPKQMVKHHLDNFNSWNESRKNDELDSALQFRDRELSKITKSKEYEKIVSQADRDTFLKEKTNKIEDYYNTRVTEINNYAEELRSKIEDDLIFFFPKRKIDYPLSDYDSTGNRVVGICLGVAINYGLKNPFAPHSMEVTFVLPNSTREVTYNLADPFLNNIKEATLAFSNVDMARSIYATDELLESWNDGTKGYRSDQTVKFIITGNISRALTNKDFKNNSTQIPFTTFEGKVKNGLLLSDNFKMNVGDINIPIVIALPVLLDMDGDKKDQYQVAETTIVIEKNKAYWIIKVGEKDSSKIFKDQAIEQWTTHKWENKNDVWSVVIDNADNLTRAIEYLDSRYAFVLLLPSAVFENYKDKLGYGETIRKEVYGIEPAPAPIEPEPPVEEVKQDEKLGHAALDMIHTKKEEEAARLAKIGLVDDLNAVEKKKLRYYLDRYRKGTNNEKDLRELVSAVDSMKDRLVFSDANQKFIERYIDKHDADTMKAHEYNTFADLVLGDFSDSLFKK